MKVHKKNKYKYRRNGKSNKTLWLDKKIKTLD